MLKNPFSFYDFLGYLFPGLVCVIFMKVIYSMDSPVTIKTILDHGLVATFSWKDTVQYTVLAYVAGHLVSYFSSLTVEPYLIWSYGYPSKFLLEANYDKKFFEINQRVGRICTYFWKSLVCLLIFPICIASILFGKILRFKYYVLKPLDSYLRENINKKIDSLLELLKMTKRNGNTDVHRVLMHYNYENYNNHIRKYDNYVVLYGFLRSLSLLCSSIFIFLLVVEIRTIKFGCEIDWAAIAVLIVTFCITYLFYLGFIKFYRRYTLENFMSIVADEKLDGKGSSELFILMTKQDRRKRPKVVLGNP